MFGAILKRWNLVELFVVPLAASLMRVSWAYLFIHIAMNNVLTAQQQIVAPFWLLVALGFCGAMVSLLDRNTSAGWVIAIGGGFLGCLISLLVVFPPQGMGLIPWIVELFRQMLYWNNALPAPLVLFLASAFLWWRGMTTEHISHDALVRAFVSGAGLLVLLLLATQVMPNILAPGQITSAMLSFIVFGLITLALGGASGALRQNSIESGTAVQVSRYWLVAVLVVISGILLLGWLVSALIAPDTVGHLLTLLDPLWRLLGQILYYIMLPFIYLLFMLLEPLLHWFEGLYKPQQAEPQPVPTPDPNDLEKIERTAKNLPPGLDVALRLILALGIVLMIAALFLVALRRRKTRMPSGIVEARESVWSWDLMKEQLASLLRRPRREAPPPPFLPLLGDAVDPRLAIRAAYQNLLALALEKGCPRSSAETPYGYIRKLLALVPDQEQTLKTITDAYVVARYSQQAPSSAQATAAWESVERIRAALGVAQPAEAKANT